MFKSMALDAVNRIPNIVEILDNTSKSTTLWTKMKALSVIVFLLGGIYFTLQSAWHKWTGVDESKLHRSLYDIEPKHPTQSTTHKSTKEVNKTNQSNRKETVASDEDIKQGSKQKKKPKIAEQTEPTEEELVSKLEQPTEVDEEEIIRNREEDEIKTRGRRRRE